MATYPTARTSNGVVVKADNVPRETKVFCLSCNQEMLLKRGDVRVPHFAHRIQPESCSGETVLHSSFKHLLAQRIEECLQTEPPTLGMRWRCHQCGQLHDGNLLRTGRQVQVEHDLGTCRPDLCLFDEQGRPRVLIEVVVTHQPELNVRQYCKKNKAHLIVFKLKSFDDLDRIQASILDPNEVTYCSAPKPEPSELQPVKEIINQRTLSAYLYRKLWIKVLDQINPPALRKRFEQAYIDRFDAVDQLVYIVIPFESRKVAKFQTKLFKEAFKGILGYWIGVRFEPEHYELSNEPINFNLQEHHAELWDLVLEHMVSPTQGAFRNLSFLTGINDATLNLTISAEMLSDDGTRMYGPYWRGLQFALKFLGLDDYDLQIDIQY